MNLQRFLVILRMLYNFTTLNKKSGIMFLTGFWASVTIVVNYSGFQKLGVIFKMSSIYLPFAQKLTL